VYGQTGKITFEVIVVDNASSDGSARAIEAEFPQVRLIRSVENLGFARANNLAASVARGRYLLLLNPDTVVLARAIERLAEFAEANADAAIFGGRTVFADGSINLASCWRRPTPWSLFCVGSGLTKLFPQSDLFARESYGGWGRDSVREVDIVSGCFLMIRAAVWNELQGFDPAFFMYGEEADLCLRARKLGHRCLICPDAEIIHHGGASERVLADKMVRLFIAKAALVARHWSKPTRRLGSLTLDLWAFSRMFAFATIRLLRPHRAQSYETWRSVWRRRREWRLAIGMTTTPALS
jgi:GT2 family glycosyltransferase